MRGIRSGRTAVVGALVLALSAFAAPVFAQTGNIKGKVVDAQNKAVTDARIEIVSASTNRTLETKTDSKGEFRQIGLAPGNYTITAQKGDMADVQQVKVGMGTQDVNFVLKPGTAAGDPKKDAARIEGIKAAFAEGATLTNAGKFDEAIAKFNEVLAAAPKCAECHANIGAIHSRQQQWDKAEEAYKKALEVNPEFVEAYTGLANVYNAQKKFKEAQAMSAEAVKRSGATGGTGNAEALYNQGVIAWNANDFQKAQELFAAAVQADAKHAESHFMLGQAYLNLGKLPEAAKEFEAYTKIAPNGPNADKAKTFYDSLKQYIK